MGIAYPSFDGSKRVGGVVAVAGSKMMMELRLKVPEKVCPMFEACIVCMFEIVGMVAGKKFVVSIVVISICRSVGLSRIWLLTS